MRVASRTVFLDTPSDVAIGTSCRAVPGGNSPSRIRCRRIEATWSATEVRFISASSIVGLDSRGAVRHVAPNHEESQVFNNSQIQLVSSLSLTCLLPPHTVPFHSSLFLFRRGRGMGPSLIQRQCPAMPYGFPVGILALPSFQTRYLYPRCPVWLSSSRICQSQSCSFSQYGNKPQKSMVQERI